MTHASTGETRNRVAGLVLLFSVLVLAVCGLVYELIAGTLSSYLLGDSTTQFSLVIGLFLSAMGVGSYLSRFLVRELLAKLIAIEILIGLVGGGTALAGFAVFVYTDWYVPALFLMVFLVGALIGLEIPLVIRLLRHMESLRVTVANVLAVDYIGALAASVLFPFVLTPYLGLVSAGMVMGLSNVLVAGVLTWLFRRALGAAFRQLLAGAAAAGALLLAGVVAAHPATAYLEGRLYQDEVVLSRETGLQRLVVTRWREDVRLFLNGHLQFSSIDEYRYHEALVHPAASLAARKSRALVLGGGDGLAARELLKYRGLEQIDLVDIDPAVTELFIRHPLLTELNQGSLSDPRVRVHNLDAVKFLEQTDELYDVIIIDLPDPADATLGKLYSRAFYRLAGRRLAAGGCLACQATSPYLSREAFWCILHTVDGASWGPSPDQSLQAVGYHTVVPTFGLWGFVIAGRERPRSEDIRLNVPTRYLTEAIIPGLFVFPPDMAEVETPVSELNDPVVFRLYHHGYHKYLD